MLPLPWPQLNWINQVRPLHTDTAPWLCHGWKSVYCLFPRCQNTLLKHLCCFSATFAILVHHSLDAVGSMILTVTLIITWYGLKTTYIRDSSLTDACPRYTIWVKRNKEIHDRRRGEVSTELERWLIVVPYEMKHGSELLEIQPISPLQVCPMSCCNHCFCVLACCGGYS